MNKVKGFLRQHKTAIIAGLTGIAGLALGIWLEQAKKSGGHFTIGLDESKKYLVFKSCSPLNRPNREFVETIGLNIKNHKEEFLNLTRIIEEVLADEED